MIDAVRLARLVHEEARTLSALVSQHDAEVAVGDVTLTAALNRVPLPALDELAYVLREVFWASTLLDEGRPCRPRVMYMPVSDRSRTAHWLTQPVALTRESLRKLAPAQGPCGYLIWTPTGRAMITGVQAPEEGDTEDLVLSAPASGAIDVSWFSFRLLTMRDGKVHGLSQRALPDARDAYGLVGDVIGAFEPRLLNTTVRAIVDHGHGGSVWLVREGHSLRSLRMDRRIEHDSRTLSERFPLEEDQKRWLVSIAHLAGTDGAVVLDSTFRMLGFGVFIPSKPVRVVRRLHDGSSETISSVLLGGGRHRSAAQFCARFAPAAAVVVSVDGRVSVMVAEAPNQMPWCAEVLSLGFATVA